MVATAGIDPSKIVKHEDFWTKDLVISCIHTLNEAKVALQNNGIGNDNSPETKVLLKNASGRDLRGLRLLSAGQRVVGSWDMALQASGISAEDVRRDQRLWTKKLILKSLQALNEAQIPLNCRHLGRDRSIETTRILHRIVGKPVTGSALYSVAYKRFPKFDDALRAAGIRPCEVRRDVKLWPKKDIRDVNENCVSWGGTKNPGGTHSREIYFKRPGSSDIGPLRRRSETSWADIRSCSFDRSLF